MPTSDSRAVPAADLAECDLVMKGGITSGIVYPPVVQILRKKYRFKSIGGTSAGAIAAALTAAAEHGREKGGFEKLQEVQNNLGREGFIVGLFQPTPAGKPLLEAGLQLLRDKRRAEEAIEKQKGKGAVLPRATLLRMADAAVRKFFTESGSRGGRVGAAIGVAVAVALAILFVVPLVIAAAANGTLGSFGRFGWVIVVPVLVLAAVLGLAGAFVGRRVGAILEVVRFFTRRLPQDRYGIVQGHAAAGGPAALTDYLSAQIDRLSGMAAGQCLTFGMLDPGGTGAGVELKCVTTNVSHGRPYVLPFEDHDFFIFKESEFAELLPAHVVAQMVKGAAPLQSVELPKGFLRVPRRDDLPVVVAMRMSLSFPVLIAAVPLYTVARSAFARRVPGELLRIDESDLQRNWFSDGGVCSNFPIHFFDAWLPGRPTFGINLTYRAEEAFTPDRRSLRPEYQSAAVGEPAGAASPEVAAVAAGPKDSIWLPRANEHRAADPEWNAVTTLPAFLGGVFSAAQNHRDNLQAGLPSYRERIVRINLAPDEGGTNLDMPPEIVGRIVEKGRLAGAALDGFRFTDHFWTRLLVLMGEIELQATMLPKGIDRAIKLLEPTKPTKPIDPAEPTDPADPGRADVTEADPGPQSYPRDDAWRAAALRRMLLIRRFVAEWAALGPPPFEGFRVRRLKPASVLRVTPNV